MARRILVLVIWCALLSLLSGCTLIGLGIGSNIPLKKTYGEREAAGPALERAVAKGWIEKGDDVEVVVSTAATPSEEGPPSVPAEGAGALTSTLHGSFDGLEHGALAVQSGFRIYDVPLDRIETARVSSGSHWLAGMLIGFATDATIATTLYFMLAAGFSGFGL